MTRDDRRDQGSRLNRRTDAEIEAMAKASVAAASTEGFYFDDVNPVEVADRLARMLRAGRDEGPPGSAAGRQTLMRSW
jgi:hypothetical protein